MVLLACAECLGMPAACDFNDEGPSRIRQGCALAMLSIATWEAPPEKCLLNVLARSMPFDALRSCLLETDLLKWHEYGRPFASLP